MAKTLTPTQKDWIYLSLCLILTPSFVFGALCFMGWVEALMKTL